MSSLPPAIADKIVDHATLLERRRAARTRGVRVVQCHGCFDIVHPGHIRHLRFARAQGDLLLVSITGDAEMRKGTPAADPRRAPRGNLAALDCVDMVYIEPRPTAAELLAEVEPDVYIKGREYETNNDPRFLREREIVERAGGTVVFSSGDVVFSSTALIAALEESADPFHARLRQLCRDEAVPLESTRRMVELLGWLELSLEPAQRVIVAGMNEGLVPAAAPADALLTDGVRRAMGLRSRSERYARDAYLLTALAESRRDDGKLTLLTLRSNTTGDPMRPSRLLFACDDQAAVQRLRNFLHGKDEAPRGGGAGRRQPGESLFPRMPLWPRPPIASMRVTAFSTYLRSPYLFYLSEVLGLREATEPAHELDARAFGVLIHQSLEQFGNGPDAHLADEQRIRVSVHEALAATADKTLGRVRSAEVEMQLEVARARLAAFAQRQAAWRSEGWVIRKVEWKPDAAVAFDVDGRDFGLRGKIDRIDEHEKTGEFAVIDYKTGDTAADPEKSHGPVEDEGRWKDLQLPLYRRIAVGAVPGLTFGVGLKLAYFSLPRRADHTQVRIAPWTDAQLAAAEEVARSVVRAVREGKFAEEGPEPPLHGAFAAIMGTALLGGEVAP